MTAALAAAALAGILVGAALVSTQVVVGDVGPGLLGLLRYALGLVILLPFAVRSMRPIPVRDLVPITIIGVGQFGIQLALLNIAVLFDTSARAALIFATLPVATLFVGIVLGRAWPGRAAAIGGILTVAGVAVSLAEPELLALEGGVVWIGIGSAVTATLVGAFCSVLCQPYLRRYGTFPVGVIATSASLVPLGLLAMVETGRADFASWGPTTFANIGFVGLASGLGFMLWLYALAHADAARVTAFLSLSPLSAALLSWLLLDSNPGWRIVFAVVLVGSGLMLAGRVPREARKPESEPLPSERRRAVAND